MTEDLRKFHDCYDLHRLKYFNVNDSGKLVINRDEVGPIIDFHTHLGLIFALAPRMNFMREVDEVEYFFPYRGESLDIDTYSAYSFSPEQAKITQRECAKAAYSGKSYMYTQTMPALLNEMDCLGVTNAVLLAVDFPFISNNTRKYLRVVEHEPRLSVFGSVHPYSSRLKERVDRCIRMGAIGIKMHPAQQFFQADNKRAQVIYEQCEKRNVPTLFHSGQSPIAPKSVARFPAIRHFKEPVARFKDLLFIFGHSGIDEYDQVIELGRKHDNVYMEVSGQPPHRIQEMINGIGEDRVLFGSDWPFYPISFPLAKALIATEGNNTWREKLLYKNGLRLLKEYGGIK